MKSNFSKYIFIIFAIGIMIFAIIHELGHLLAGILLGMKPKKIEIMPFGVSISFNVNTLDYNKKIKSSSSLFNFALTYHYFHSLLLVQ